MPEPYSYPTIGSGPWILWTPTGPLGEIVHKGKGFWYCSLECMSGRGRVGMDAEVLVPPGGTSCTISSCNNVYLEGLRGARVSWAYRIVKYKDRDDYGLHEAYFNEAGLPYAMTENPVHFSVSVEEGPDTIREELRAAADAEVIDEPKVWPGKPPWRKRV